MVARLNRKSSKQVFLYWIRWHLKPLCKRGPKLWSFSWFKILNDEPMTYTPIMVDLVFTTTYDFSIILNWIIPNLLVCAVCLEIGHPQKICDDGARMLSLLLYRNIPQTVHWIKVEKYIFKTTVINLVLSCGLYCTIRVLDFF